MAGTWPNRDLAIAGIRKQPVLVVDTLATHLTQVQLNGFFALLYPEASNKVKLQALVNAEFNVLGVGYGDADDVVIAIKEAQEELEEPRPLQRSPRNEA